MSLLPHQALMMAAGAAPLVGDPFFPNVVTLLHLDNTYSDVIGKAWTPSGSPVFDTTTPLFGSGSLGPMTTGQNVTSTDASYALGTDDFTIEMSVRFPSGTTPGATYLLDSGAGNRTVLQFTSAGFLAYYDAVSSTGSTLYTNGPSRATVCDGNKHRIAVSRNSGTITAYFDGVQWGSFVADTDNKTDTTFHLNEKGDGTNRTALCTYDEIRITKGVGRYLAGYTPSALPFPGNSPAGTLDPSWSKVKVLLHGEGTNGGTVYTDEHPRLWTASGSVVTSTAQAKWGASSLFFANSATTNFIANGRAFQSPIGTQEFCIEAWVYFTGATGEATIAGQAANGFSFSRDTNRHLKFSQAFVSVDLTGAILVPTNQWVHCAVARVAGTLRLFVDGVMDTTVSYTKNLSAIDCSVGGYSSNNNVNGYIDDFRITVGDGRYSSTFTPPTAAFPAQ